MCRVLSLLIPNRGPCSAVSPIGFKWLQGGGRSRGTEVDPTFPPSMDQECLGSSLHQILSYDPGSCSFYS